MRAAGRHLRRPPALGEAPAGARRPSRHRPPQISQAHRACTTGVRRRDLGQPSATRPRPRPASVARRGGRSRRPPQARPESGTRSRTGSRTVTITPELHVGPTQPRRLELVRISAESRSPARDIARQPKAQRVALARSVECPCQARPSQPCGPSGDHLARYVHAYQRGVLPWHSLKDVIASLDILGPYVLIQSPHLHAVSAPPNHHGSDAMAAAGGRQARAPEVGQ